VQCCLPHEFIVDQAKQLGAAIGDHGGRWETSVLLALRPDLVDLSRLSKGGKKNPAGVDGEHPRKATPEFGRRCVHAMVQKMSLCAQTILRLL
jgi:creatinine amidohydrolase